MTDIPELPFLPPGLHLDDDDVIEGIEELHDHGELDLDGEIDGEIALTVDDVDPEADGDQHVDDDDDLHGVDDELVDEGAAEQPEERVSGFDGIGTRRESRERALALLYEAEQKSLLPLAEVLDTLPVRPSEFAVELVVGVSDHLEEIDELIGHYSVGWTVVRMPSIDRALLRLASYELCFTEVPVGACISEAVELAKRYSTDDSHTFVNGLLSKLATEVRTQG